MLETKTTVELDEPRARYVGYREKSSAVRPPLETYLREINETPLLSADEEKQLAYRIIDGDREAHDHMVRANLRLVVRIARDYIGRGLPLQDLISEGNLGVMRAADKFDPTMNTRFNTYATFWIKQSIKRTIINTVNPIRLPVYVYGLLSKWRNKATDLGLEPRKEANSEKIANALGLDEKKRKIVRRAFQSSCSQTGQEVEKTLVDNSEQPKNRVEDAENIKILGKCMDKLDERDAKVLRMLNGMKPYKREYTLREIAEELGISRPAVSTIKLKVLEELKTLMDMEEEHQIVTEESEPPVQGLPVSDETKRMLDDLTENIHESTLTETLSMLSDTRKRTMELLLSAQHWNRNGNAINSIAEERKLRGCTICRHITDAVIILYKHIFLTPHQEESRNFGKSVEVK